jgi:hypothetical protein
MTINQLTAKARDKSNFLTLQGYLDFCQSYLDYVAVAGNLQAVIVSRNENHYRFWQYDKTTGYQVTRPINSQLMYQAGEFEPVRTNLLATLRSLKEGGIHAGVRSSLNNAIYTLQQSIGAALDGLPAGESNTARKLNGDLFERLIQLILQEMGIGITIKMVRVPIVVEGQELFKMNYQHDLSIVHEGQVKAIGSVKTTSKDRIDKIFMDKFLYSKLTNSQLPHIAIFLNDVQRKGTLPDFGISSTFLPGHFKGYTVKLNPLDGVYYCDLRPNMKTEPILKDHIKTLDHLLCTDIWSFLQRTEPVPLEVAPEI